MYVGFYCRMNRMEAAVDQIKDNNTEGI
jgi:hypothetical protein